MFKAFKSALRDWSEKQEAEYQKQMRLQSRRFAMDRIAGAIYALNLYDGSACQELRKLYGKLEGDIQMDEIQERLRAC